MITLGARTDYSFLRGYGTPKQWLARAEALGIEALAITDYCSTWGHAPFWDAFKKSKTKLIYGDSLSLSIAAASVIAKVHRDALMRELDLAHPGYGLASHKGYGTPEHRRALKEHGPCALHRRTFAPVQAVDPNAVVEAQVANELLFDDFEMEEEAEWA